MHIHIHSVNYVLKGTHRPNAPQPTSHGAQQAKNPSQPSRAPNSLDPNTIEHPWAVPNKQVQFMEVPPHNPEHPKGPLQDTLRSCKVTDTRHIFLKCSKQLWVTQEN